MLPLMHAMPLLRHGKQSRLLANYGREYSVLKRSSGDPLAQPHVHFSSDSPKSEPKDVAPAKVHQLEVDSEDHRNGTRPHQPTGGGPHVNEAKRARPAANMQPGGDQTHSQQSKYKQEESLRPQDNEPESMVMQSDDPSTASGSPAADHCSAVDSSPCAEAVKGTEGDSSEDTTSTWSA
jgi:hypothetical protein